MRTTDAVTRMTLDRIIECGEPITRLAVDTEVPADPLLQVHGHRVREVVHANTGERYQGGERTSWRLAADNLAGFSLPDGLQVRVDGTDVLVRTTGDTGEWRTLRGHTTPVTTVTTCPSPDGPLVVSASAGGSIRLWDPRSGEQQRIGLALVRADHLVSWIGPDGTPRIASGDDGGDVKIWDPLLPPVPRIGPVSTRGFSDRVAREDLLDLGALVDALTEVLRPGEDDGPVVITVEGTWGSGKSTVLELVKNRMSAPATAVPPGRRLTVFRADRLLSRPPAGATPPAPETPTTHAVVKPLVVSFNPWRHQSSEQVWAGLAKAVTDAVQSAIMPHPDTRERYWFAANVHRVDRRHLQRQLWKRVHSPLLSFAGLGFGLSALGALTKLNLGWAWWVTAGLAGLGLLHTAKRYFRDRASAFLPGELFTGPVASNAFHGTATDPAIRDPYYHARSGYLYLVQHDVQALLEDLAAHGYRLVLLIDDLDRCTPRTTAQVFEAINVFLSEDFPATRFVLGLDSSVVASHVDHAYKELADAEVVAHPDDPSPGWTFLRKLVQLPVRLPRTTADSVDHVLLAQLGPVHEDHWRDVHAEATLSADSAVFAESVGAESVFAESRGAQDVDRIVVAVERHAEVRDHLRRRLKAQPEQSVREEKRLLNVWQFHLRVLGSVDVGQACHLVAVAEIATRWPAYLHRLRGGWADLARAVDDDVRWGATIARLGFAHSDRGVAANLRALLRDGDARAVAALADRLL
ncbi:P-loop NTPase fold protein [Actinosynnema sp. NPDC091369]